MCRRLPDNKKKLAEYVAHAHSWYKHLPGTPPGVEFYFFIDKYAGCDRVLMGDGTATIAERTKRGFHYSDIPADQYRARFGCLAFSCGFGTTVYLESKGPIVMPRDKTAAVPGDDAQLYDLPPQILEAGVALLTAVIHDFSGSDPFWIVGASRPDEIEWPHESGGQAVVEKIFARWRIMQEPMSEEKKVRVMGGCVDPVLHELLVPERRRQYQEMIEAMDRVCDVIDEQRKRARRLRNG